MKENWAMMGERKKFLLGGLLLVLLALGLSTGWLLTQKHAPGKFGAISMSQNSMGFGTAWGYSNAISAYERSQKECDNSGAKDCIVRVSLTGNCGALVMSSEHRQSFVVTDGDKNSAGALALAQCQATGAMDCAIQTNFCGNGS